MKGRCRKEHLKWKRKIKLERKRKRKRGIEYEAPTLEEVPPGDLLFIYDKIGNQKVECFHVYILKLKYTEFYWKLEIDYENSAIITAFNNVDIQPPKE